MTQQDDWRPEMARLAQRQDLLERQQRETTTRVDALNRDVDRRMDSQCRDIDRQFRDGERRVGSLERSRDTFENLFWFSMPLVAAVAVIIILVIAVVAAREQRQEAGEPEQRSPSSINAPLAGSGGPLQPGLAAAGTPFRQPNRSDSINATRATMAGGPRSPGRPGNHHSIFGPAVGACWTDLLDGPGSEKHRWLLDASSKGAAGVAAALP